jgi:hypothetical protein
MVSAKLLNSILLEENKSPPRSGIVMLLVECPEALKLAKLIDSDDLYNDRGMPVEHFHHITVRYGINEYDPMKMQDLLGDQPVVNTGASAIKEIGFFENVMEGEADCVHLEISDEDTSQLAKIKKLIEDHFDCQESQFKDYRAHITIAYVKKGKGKEIANLLNFKYDELNLGDFALNGSTLFYSDGNQKESTIYLGGVV